MNNANFPKITQTLGIYNRICRGHSKESGIIKVYLDFGRAGTNPATIPIQSPWSSGSTTIRDFRNGTTLLPSGAAMSSCRRVPVVNEHARLKIAFRKHIAQYARGASESRRARKRHSGHWPLLQSHRHRRRDERAKAADARRAPASARRSAAGRARRPSATKQTRRCALRQNVCENCGLVVCTPERVPGSRKMFSAIVH